jgi:DNA repair exonuclease SbcCD ATPase subunit
MTHSNSETPEKLKIQETINRLRQIRKDLKQNLSSLHEQLEVLDSKSDLENRFATLKKDAEVRARDLEAEVEQLREELRSIKALLGIDLQNQDHVGF